MSAALLIALPPGKASLDAREASAPHSGNEIRSNQGPNGIKERVRSSSARRALHEHGEFLAVEVSGCYTPSFPVRLVLAHSTMGSTSPATSTSTTVVNVEGQVDVHRTLVHRGKDPAR